MSGIAEIEEVPFEVLEKWREQASQNPRPSKRSFVVSKRRNKNCPTELSSKNPVSTYKDITIEGVRRKRIDPRFEASSGEFSEARFRKNFSFVYDEELPKEAEAIQKKLKSTSEKTERGNLKKELSRVHSVIQEEKERRLKENTSRRIKSAMVKNSREGKKPFYLSRSDRKKLHLIEKFKTLKQEGNLEKYMEKKRKKNQKKTKKKGIKPRNDKDKSQS